MRAKVGAVVLLCAAFFGAGVARAEVFVGAGVNNNSYDYSDLGNSSGSKFFVGYYGERGFFGELAFIDLGKTESDSAPLGLDVGGAAMYLGYRSQNRIGFGFLGKIGVYSFDSDLLAFGSTVATQSSSGLAWGLGLLYAFNEHFAVRAEIEQFVGVADFANDESISGGSVSLEFRF